MSDLTFENAMFSWGIFWLVYWISGIYLSWKNHANRPVDNLSQVLSCLLLNMIWTFIGTIIIFYVPIRLETTFNIVIKLLLCNIITEIWFYHMHLLLHHPHLYKKFHKTHHRYSNPYSLTALYCSGYEAVVCNVFAVGLGPVMLNIPSPYLYIWFGLVALNSTVTHSGYRVGWIIDGSHDFHHSNQLWNFGTMSLFDRIYGTYKDPSPDNEISNDTNDDQSKIE